MSRSLGSTGPRKCRQIKGKHEELMEVGLEGRGRPWESGQMNDQGKRTPFLSPTGGQLSWSLGVTVLFFATSPIRQRM